jgi:hypothetical protein
MGLPSITATVYYKDCLDDEFNGEQYVKFNDENFFIDFTPTSSKQNTDLLYKHEITFHSEREVLGNVYFTDSVHEYSLTKDKPCSNSTSFKFYGNIKEFVDRLNCALLFAGVGDSILQTKTYLTTEDTPVGDGFCAMIDPLTDFDYEESEELSFDDLKILAAIEEVYNTLEITYEFHGRKIIFGGMSNTVNRTFKYGSESELLSITKTNSNNKIVNKVSFKGSEDNIPHYYPNLSEFSNIALTSQKVQIKTPELLVDKVRENTDVTCRIIEGGYALWDKDFLEFNNDSVEPNKAYPLEERPASLWLRVGIKTTGRCDLSVSDVRGIFTFKDKDRPSEEVNFITYVPPINADGPKFYLYDQDQNFITYAYEMNGVVECGIVEEGLYSLVIDTGFPTYKYYVHDYVTNTDTQVNDVTSLTITNVAVNGDSKVTYSYVSGEDSFSTLAEIGCVGNLSNGESFRWYTSSRIEYQSNLMPSIYRSTAGAERFYYAENNTFVDPDTGEYYHFNNPFKAGKPSDYILTDEDIMPTIEGIENSKGELFGEIADIAFDDDDSDALKADVDDDGTLSAENYEHSYFYIKLHIYDGENGFDLFGSATQTDSMTINMTSGSCNGCKFLIQSTKFENEEGYYYFKNPVLVKEPDGDIVDGSYSDKVLGDTVVERELQSYQQYTNKNSIWICVQKDVSTFGVICPNAENNYKPSVGDKFKITNINLPQSYILAAEKRGEEEAIRYMAENNDEKFTFSIDFSRIFFAENPLVLKEISEYSKLDVQYNKKIYNLYVSSFTYECKGSELLPEISVELSEDVETSYSFQEQIVDRVQSIIANSGVYGSGSGSGAGLTASQIDRRYLRKDADDTASGTITFKNGYKSYGNSKFGDFVTGLVYGKGGQIDELGNAEFESIISRGFIQTPELRFNRVDTVSGELWNSIAFGTIESVDTEKCLATLKLEEGEAATIKVSDICRGIFSNFGNGEQTEEVDECGFQRIYGFSTSYFTPTDIIVNQTGKCQFRYALKAGTTVHPSAAMKFAVYGNFTDKSRQASAYMTRTYTRYLSGVNTWEIEPNRNIVAQYGLLDGLTIGSMEMSGYGSFQSNAYFKGVIVKFTPSQLKELKGESAYSVTLTNEEAVVKVNSDGEVISLLEDVNVTADGENVTADGVNVIVKENTINTRIQAYRGSTELFFSPTYQEGGYTVAINTVGCEASVVNGLLFVTSISDADNAYIDLYVSCEGNATFEKRFSITSVMSGESTITADLTNEMTSVACDSDGNLLFGLPFETSVNMWYGNLSLAIDKVELIDNSDVTASVDGNKVTVSDIQKGTESVQLGIKATTTYSEKKYERTVYLTILRQLAGADAVIYDLLPSVNAISLRKDGSYSVSEVSCSLKYQTKDSQGIMSSLPDGYSMRYSYDHTAGYYTYGSYVKVETSDSITFSLYFGDTLVDTETIPVVHDGADGAAGKDGKDGKDGAAGKDGEKGEDGTSITIVSKTITYAVTDTYVQPADSAFTYTSYPTASENKYIWSKTTVVYSDGTTTNTYGCTKVGYNGTSVTVSSVTTEYGYSSSDETEPTTWYVKRQTWNKGVYEWQRTRTIFSDGTSYYTYTTTYKPFDGEEGAAGTSVLQVFRYDTEKPSTPDSGETPSGWKKTSNAYNLTCTVSKGDGWTESDGVYYSPKETADSTTYKSKITFTASEDNSILFLGVGASTESGYDMAVVGKIDSDTIDKSDCTAAVSGEDYQTVKLEIPTKGTHYVWVAYVKDGSKSDGDDQISFTISTIDNLYTSFGYTTTSGDVVWSEPIRVTADTSEEEYIYLLSDSSAIPSAPATAATDRGKDGLLPVITKYSYASDTTYSAGDEIAYNGKYYRCKVGCKNIVPTNSNYWLQIYSWSKEISAVTSDFPYQYVTKRIKQIVWTNWGEPWLFNMYGREGERGKNGVIVRLRGVWDASVTDYVYNDEYRDVVIYEGNKYQVLNQGTTVPAGSIPSVDSGSDNNGIWEMADTFNFIATDTLIADSGNIGGFSFSTSKNADKTDKLVNGHTVGWLSSVETDDNGDPVLQLNSETGEIKASKGTFSGDVKVQQGNTIVRISANGTSGMSILSGETENTAVEKTSFTGDEMTYDQLFSGSAASSVEIKDGDRKGLAGDAITLNAEKLNTSNWDVSYKTWDGSASGTDLFADYSFTKFTVNQTSLVTFTAINGGNIIETYIKWDSISGSEGPMGNVSVSQRLQFSLVRVSDGVEISLWTMDESPDLFDLTGSINHSTESISVKLDAGTYKLKAYSYMDAFVDKKSYLGSLDVVTNIYAMNVSIDPSIYRSMFFGNGFAIGTSLLQRSQMIVEDSIMDFTTVSGNGGIKVSSGVLYFKIGGSWYQVGVNGTTISLTKKDNVK